MFFAFLNKERADCLDISALIKFPPTELLYYYYNSVVKIPWEYYWEIKEAADNSSEATNPCKEWLELFERELNAEADLCDLCDSEFVDLIGPYYYLPSNTRFYFGKNFLNDPLGLNSEDLANMATLTNISPLNKEVQAYGKGKKSKHKTGKSKDELLRDINLCLISLQEIERLNKQINFWGKILENRYSLRKQENLFPLEPDVLPEKPEAPAESRTPDNTLPFPRLLPRPKKTPASIFDYSQKMKIYLIRYREYEKSCDRYKEALENWPDYRELFFSNCLSDIKEAEENLEMAKQNRQTYHEIIQKSMIHSDYQDTKTLKSFGNYLKTGRANELQECLNIFEEKNWTDIKASQERIENTIHFLQNSDPDSRFAYENINLFLDNFHEKGGELAKAEA